MKRTAKLIDLGTATIETKGPIGTGFDDTPVGQKLQAVSQKWNQEIYGTPNPDTGGFEFKLNTGDNGFDGAPTIYKGPSNGGGP